jgi:hypothetical protein
LENFQSNVKNGWGSLVVLNDSADVTLNDPVSFLNGRAPTSNISIILPKVNLPNSTLLLGRAVRFWNFDATGHAFTIKSASSFPITPPVVGGGGVEIVLASTSGLTDQNGSFFIQAVPTGATSGGGSGFNAHYFFGSSVTAQSPTFHRLATTDLSDLPIPESSGGTGDTGTAWTSYTPTVASGIGTLTTASATGRYKSLGKTVFIEVNVTITANGTGGGWVEASLPGGLTPAVDASYTLAGSTLQPRLCGIFLRTVNGNVGGPHVRFFQYDGTYPGGSGQELIASGVYESG